MCVRIIRASELIEDIRYNRIITDVRSMPDCKTINNHLYIYSREATPGAPGVGTLGHLAPEFYPGGGCQFPVTPAMVPDRCPLARRLSNASVDMIYSRPISFGDESVEQAAAAAGGDTVWPAHIANRLTFTACVVPCCCRCCCPASHPRLPAHVSVYRHTLHHSLTHSAYSRVY